MDIIKAVEKTNIKQRKLFIEKIISVYEGNIKGKTLGVWGLAFKPKTNDMREAPSITIINKLLELNTNIKVFDPKAMETAKLHFGDRVTYATNAYEAIENADGLLLLTEWNEFRRPDFEKIKSLMRSPIIFDGRNQYEPKTLTDIGFKYYSIGK